MRNREVSRFAIDFDLALRNDFGMRPEVDPPQFRIGYRVLCCCLVQLDDLLSCGRRSAVLTPGSVVACGAFDCGASVIAYSPYSRRPETQAGNRIITGIGARRSFAL